MEDAAIKEGFENLRSGTEYDALYEAALCRERADWIVGMNATRLFSALYGQTLNVGRVMPPTLAMAVMREAAISAFKPEPFYTIQIGLDGFTAASERFKTEGLLRIIQSISSPKAEPFKRWLAQVGRERIEETIDPEQAIDRALETYQKKGYDTDWIHQRLLSIRVRNELTAEWQERGVQQGKEYAILTDEITKAWSGMTTRQYKKLKGLKKENLRDNMSTMEIVLNMLAEATTTELSKAHQPEGFSESQKIARRGGSYAGQVRQDIEKDTGRPVITSQNAAQLNAVVVDMIESVAETEKPDNDENK